jgi:hypothetical protein
MRSPGWQLKAAVALALFLSFLNLALLLRHPTAQPTNQPSPQVTKALITKMVNIRERSYIMVKVSLDFVFMFYLCANISR